MCIVVLLAKLYFADEFHDIFVVIRPFAGQIVLHTDLFLFLLRSLGSVSDGWSPDIMGPLSLLMLSSSGK